MKTATETLEEQLAVFTAELAPDLDRLRHVVPRFVSLFTETVLSTIVLEHALRKKGLLGGDELTDALVEAQQAMKRIRARGMTNPAGRA
jgi:hypothetical protein